MNDIPLVFVPGAVCNHRLFAAQTKYFGDQHDVIIPDLTQDASIKKMAQTVLLNAPERFALVGLSMGGIVALEIMRAASDRVERLALLDTNSYPDGIEQQHIRRTQIELVKSNGVESLLSLLNTSLMPRYIAPNNTSADNLEELVRQMTLEVGPEGFVRHWRALINRPDSNATLEQISCPTLVLCGRDDAMCSVSLHREMAAKIKGSELEIVENCGHLSTMEAPNRVNAALLQWISREK